jgi:YVTN family beta-propeller protein
MMRRRPLTRASGLIMVAAAAISACTQGAEPSGPPSASATSQASVQLPTTVQITGDPYGVAATMDGSRVYVANLNSDSVSVIDTGRNSVIADIPGDHRPLAVAPSPDGRRVYVTNQGSNTVSVIDGSTNTVSATIPVGEGPTGIAVTPDGSQVYVANQEGRSISIIDTSSNSVTTTISDESSAFRLLPSDIAITPEPYSERLSPDSVDFEVGDGA